ncbi:MAG: MBOAT family protein, partial [Oscillospiraceae bacterium]|nr:MBOAT family protein [Oscillospiraceae bacterium]
MLFNSFDFLVFFPIVVLVFFFIPRRLRSIWLLVTSYYFYMGWNPKYALLIAFSTLVTFLS